MVSWCYGVAAQQVLGRTNLRTSPMAMAMGAISAKGWKSCLQLTPLNLNYFKMVEDMRLKLLHWYPLEWYYLLAKFYESLLSSSKVISGTHTHTHTHTHTYTHRQTGDLICLLSFLESRLNNKHTQFSHNIDLIFENGSRHVYTTGRQYSTHKLYSIEHVSKENGEMCLCNFYQCHFLVISD
jgi:hypothetical protein